MAKDKKNITDFRQALLSQSKFIAAETKEPDSAPKKAEKKAGSPPFSVELKPDTFSQLEKLAGDYNLDVTEFTNLALEHFLKIDYVKKS